MQGKPVLLLVQATAHAVWAQSQEDQVQREPEPEAERVAEPAREPAADVLEVSVALPAGVTVGALLASGSGSDAASDDDVEWEAVEDDGAPPVGPEVRCVLMGSANRKAVRQDD